MAIFPFLHAYVHWRAILSGRLVAEFDLQNPRIHINLAQLRAEAKSQIPVEERGWQGAVQAIYPLKINLLTIRDGDVVYIDEDPKRPLHLSQIQLQAENIRNVVSPERTYPSPFSFAGKIFEDGLATVRGNADFLAEPHPGGEADVEMESIALDYFRPVLSRYNISIDKGIFSATGRVEYAPEIKTAHLKTLTAQNLKFDYIHSAKTAPKGKERVEKVKQAGKEASNKPGLLLRVDDLHLTGQVGMINKATTPSCRLYWDSLDFRLTNLSNQFSRGEARARFQGRFMGSGKTLATATFRPETKGPDFDLNVKIEGTQVTSMNDLLRVYGNFDVVAGSFSLYSELSIKNDEIEGYLKPIFKDLDVYDLRQEEEKNLFKKMYEGLVGGVLTLLKNQPRDQVATRVDLSGEVENPEASTLQIILRLIQNAFLKAILPGFEQEVCPNKQKDSKAKK